MELSSRNSKIKRKAFTLNIFDIFAVLYLAHKLLPSVGQYMPSVVYLAVFAAVMFLMASATWKLESGAPFLKLMFIFSISALSLVHQLFTSDIMSVALNLYGELQIVAFALIGLWYTTLTDGIKARRALIFIAVCYAITTVTTYIGNIIYPGASRLLATLGTGDTEYTLYTGINIGSFSFIYELVLVVPLIIYLIKTKRINPIWSAVILVVITLTLMQAEYTIAIIFFAISLITLVIKTLTAKKVVVILVICLLLLLLASNVIANLFDTMADIIPSETIAVRFEYVAATLRGEVIEEDEDAGDRMELYKKAIDGIRQGGIIGGWGETSESGHSLVLDTIVRYGLIGALVLLATFTSIFRYAIKPYKKKDYYPYLLWIFIAVILLTILNPKINLFIFICVIPLFARVMDDLKKGEETDEIAVDSK